MHRQILRVIQLELEPYGPAAAAVEFAGQQEFGGWCVNVTPANAGAAPLEVGVDIWGCALIVVANSSTCESIDNSLLDDIALIAGNVSPAGSTKSACGPTPRISTFQHPQWSPGRARWTIVVGTPVLAGGVLNSTGQGGSCVMADHPAGGPAVSPKGMPWADFDADLLGRNIFDGSTALPSAVLLAAAVEHNIATMATYCRSHGVLLAPHGKTTMSPELITRQVGAGAWAITVATAWQAAAVAAMGVQRILLANEVTDPGSLRLLDQLLTSRPELELWCYVDAIASLELAEAGLSVPARGRVRLLIELGVDGGRAGLRPAADALALARRVADGPLPLAGVAAFEGLIDGGSPARTLDLVDHLLGRCVALAVAATDAGLIGVEHPVLTAGGSAYFDRVVAVAGPALAGTSWRTVLRSGCYVTHDHGTYEQLSPLAGRAVNEEPRLLPALQVIGAVLSVPEAGRAIVGVGRRDASFDAGLPVPLLVRRGDVLLPTGPDWSVTALNDQHAYLDVPTDVRVGDVVVFGISHPCTTFDKWRVLPMVDDDYSVVGVVHTCF